MREEDLAKYYEHYGAAQGIERMRPGFARLARRMVVTGTAAQQMTVGTDAGMQADEHALSKLPKPTPAQKAKAHEIRNMLAVKGLINRPYEG